jgi:hypothetical protein
LVYVVEWILLIYYNMSDKKARGKTKDKEDGEWKCLECQKSYLSYPAFYTHCKTKHDSKWPK